MGKKIDEMSYLEMIAEIERVEIALLNTKSLHLKRDYNKYLLKLKKEVKDYEAFHGLKVKKVKNVGGGVSKSPFLIKEVP